MAVPQFARVGAQDAAQSHPAPAGVWTPYKAHCSLVGLPVIPGTVQLVSRFEPIELVVSSTIITLYGPPVSPSMAAVAAAVSVIEGVPIMLAKVNGTFTVCTTWMALSPAGDSTHAIPWFDRVVGNSTCMIKPFVWVGSYFIDRFEEFIYDPREPLVIRNLNLFDAQAFRLKGKPVQRFLHLRQAVIS